MVFFGQEGLEKGGKVKISPLRWKSYKQDRHTQSTLGAELMALARGIAEANWIRSLFGEALNESYRLDQDRSFRNKIGLTVTIDNRPIYDHTMGEGVVIKDKRMAVDMLLVRKDVRSENINLRWVESSNMIADVMTKMNVSLGLLFSVLKTGDYLLSLKEMMTEVPSQPSTKGCVNTAYLNG